MTVLNESLIRSRSVPRASARAWSERLQGAIMVGLLAAGAWQGIAALTTTAAQRRLEAVLDGPSVLAGRTAAAINYAEAHYLPADGLLRAAGGILRYRLFRSGGPQVVVGNDDWLYLVDELRPWPDAAAHMRSRADTLARVAARLAERGTSLTVVLVPDKARVESATLGGAPRSEQAKARYATFMDLLRDRSVSAVDLATPFAAARRDRPLFYRTDTHWNQDGAALAAGLVAQRTLSASPDLANGGYRFETTHASDLSERPGDLLRLMSLDQVVATPLKLRPAPDRQLLETTTQVEAPPQTGGLLDDGPGGQVVLLGSSFSLNGNFQGRLEEALHLPVGNFAEAGGGFASSARTYFKGGAYVDGQPKAVIWEIPERVLGQPLDAADRALAEDW